LCPQLRFVAEYQRGRFCRVGFDNPVGCAINIDYVADFNFLLCRKNDLHVAVNDDRSIYFAGCVFRFNADRSELNIIRFMLDSTDNRY
ncbi:hypothetical protein ACM7TS_10330, partial [Enterobacter hormaechei]